MIDRLRHTRAHPCPVCGGGDDMPRGRGMRCSGWTTADGYMHCARSEYAGGLPIEGGGTYAHYLVGPCRCGKVHRSAAATPVSAGGGARRRVLGKTRYEIKDAEGVVVALHVREDFVVGGRRDKAVWWERPSGEKGLGGVPLGTLPLYRLVDLLPADSGTPVVLVEGERAADALAAVGVVAVGTVTGAAGTPDTEVLRPLAGRSVVLWPDHDDTGGAHMERVGRRLAELGVAARVVRWGEREGDDAADYLARGGTAESARGLIEAAEPWTPTMAPEGNEESLNEVEQEVERLAALPPLGYERERQAAAERLGIRVVVLDGEVTRRRPTTGGTGLQGTALRLADPEPWPESVDGGAVLDEVVSEIGKYVMLSKDALDAVALWIAHSHILAVARDTFDVTPRLILQSPTPRCGKTTLLSLVELLVPRALNTANITPPAIFRTIDLARPTLIIDEADALFGEGKEDLRGLLNAGHRSGCDVVRVVGQDHEPRAFDVFAPVALAAIGHLPATLEDRGIVIGMKRRAPGERVERAVRRKLVHLEEIKRRLFRWAADNAPNLAAAAPRVPEALDDRAADNWNLLLAIADEAGGGWPERSRAVAISLSAVRIDQSETRRIRLLADVKSIFDADGTGKIASATLAARLAEIEEAPWGEWGRREKPITPPQLARLLAGFGVRPRTIRFPGGETAKGYILSDFADPFTRYLPEFNPSHRHKPPVGGPNGQKDENSDPSHPYRVTDWKKAAKGHQRPENGVCDGVTDGKGGPGTGKFRDRLARLNESWRRSRRA